MTVVARCTGHTLLTIEIVLIDRHGHGHHFAGGLLVALFIGGKAFVPFIRNVAEPAVHTECPANELHRRKELVGRNVLQHLNICELLALADFLFTALRGVIARPALEVGPLFFDPIALRSRL